VEPEQRAAGRRRGRDPVLIDGRAVDLIAYIVFGLSLVSVWFSFRNVCSLFYYVMF